ncbi:hypothetical protein [Synechococcus sp. BO 8801]|uniref:hypothetical protein n=1 Tax=Synechococcus sp. BO 8801 TaxID=169670 RepID=UPI000B98164F|nr:hypothetical protein [Synechococcus sp. BO 8801]
MRIVALLLALALAGCGSNPQSEATKTADVATSISMLTVMAQSMAYDSRVASGALDQKDMAMACFYGRRTVATGEAIKAKVAGLPDNVKAAMPPTVTNTEVLNKEVEAACKRAGF